MKIRELLKSGICQLNQTGVEEAILKARILLAHEMQITSQDLSLHLEKEVSQECEQKFWKEIEELKQGMPIQYLTNQQWFYGIEFYVNHHVLIPQPDTEILVEEVIEVLKNSPKKRKILDLCTGSGAIAIALAKHTNAKIKAADISEQALKIARKNANLNEVEIEFFQSNMFENVNEKFDWIVSNPPYIETKTLQNLPQEVKNEPRLALNGGKDGLDFYHILGKEAPKYLAQGGFLAVEIGFNQKEKVMKILKDSRFCEIYSKKDLGGNDRIVVRKMEEIKCHFRLKSKKI